MAFGRTSNPNVGTHSRGARTGKAVPNRKSQGPSGSFVGTGVNRKTGATPQYQGSQPRSGTDSQPEDFINQSPSPWDNSQPSSKPSGVATNWNPGGSWRQPTSAPGNPPTRSQGSAVPRDLNTPVGYKQGYKPANQAGNPLIDGNPKKTNNADNGGQPVAKKAPKMKTNLDIFGPGLAAYKRYGG